MEKWKTKWRDFVYAHDVRQLVPQTEPMGDVRAKEGGRVKAHKRAQEQRVYNLKTGLMDKKERVLKDDFDKILELSCRAAECPLCLNADVYMGFCSYNCRYCFSLLHLESLMTAFYDAGDSGNVMRLRPASTRRIKEQLIGYLNGRFKDGIQDAFNRRVPVRLGIRMEDFLPAEEKHQRSKLFLDILAEYDYPCMVNTKSDLFLKWPDLWRTLSECDVAVQESIIVTDDKQAKLLEPGAPSSSRRFQVLKEMNESGIRAMARIEPYMVGINDNTIDEYVNMCLDANVPHVTTDTYSYFANSLGIRFNMLLHGFDYEWMFRATSEYQEVGSLALEKLFFKLQDSGVGCSSFNFQSLPLNSRGVCCGVSETTFKTKSDYNYYNLLTAGYDLVKGGKKNQMSLGDFKSRYKPLATSLTFDAEFTSVESAVDGVWNKKSFGPWSLDWIAGVKSIGQDEHGIVYEFDPDRVLEVHERMELVMK